MTTELKINQARRAFPEAQALLTGVPGDAVQPMPVVGWHDTNVSDERGSFCLVQIGSELEELAGQTFFFSTEFGSCFAYVLGRASLQTPISLTRRAFLSVAPLSMTEMQMLVQEVG